MRDGNVPRFFCAAGKAQLVGRRMAQLAAQLSSSQLFQLFRVSLVREGRGERLEERTGRRGGQKKVEGMEEDGKLLVEQIKTKTARSRAALYYIIVPQFALPFQRPEGSH